MAFQHTNDDYADDFTADADDDYSMNGGEEAYDEGLPYKPPGSGDAEGQEKQLFHANVPKTFIVPERLRDKPYELIEAANDWHYAMMNDHPRNEFYRDCLRRVITPESIVLEIGAGSGLLSIIAASLGAKKVVAIEANRHLANVANEIIRRNGFEGRIHIINKMSTEVAPDEVNAYGGGTPTVLLSEILGTLLLGESALHYVMDARQRLVTKDAAVVPRAGCQFATLIESEDIGSITSVRSWESIDLSWFNTLQDTTSMVFTKQYGFRFSSCKYRELAQRQPVLRIDFAQDAVGIWRAAAGMAAAAAIPPHTPVAATMSTHPDATLDNFPRDMQWGQGLQLIEDLAKASAGDAPAPFIVTEGEWLVLVTRYSADGVTLQFQLERDVPDAD